MFFGCLIGGKSYALRKYLMVSLVVTGAVIFLYKPNLFASETSIIIGYSLVAFSLLMNGLSAGVQEKMRSVARPTPLNMMLFINSWSSLFLVVGVAVSGELPGFIEFCRTHPEIIYMIGIICFVGALGQIFTTTMITSFGVVPCCLVLTVRKFFNVLFSVLYYGHTLDVRQWLAIALIFTSLFADAIMSFTPSKNDKNKSEKAKSEKIIVDEKIALKIEEEKMMCDFV
jgi:solute carrier family 35 (UDP-galactose transporter), member B1